MDSGRIAPNACARAGGSSSRSRSTGSTGGGARAFRVAKSPQSHRKNRSMKKIALAIATLSAVAVPAFAMAASFPDRARVLGVHPIHDRIPVSREECWNDVQRGYEERRVT